MRAGRSDRITRDTRNRLGRFGALSPEDSTESVRKKRLQLSPLTLGLRDRFGLPGGWVPPPRARVLLHVKMVFQNFFGVCLDPLVNRMRVILGGARAGLVTVWVTNYPIDLDNEPKWADSPGMPKRYEKKTDRVHRPLATNEARKETFLATLRQTGIWSAACRAASPDSPDGAKSSFRDLYRRDPQFRAQCDDALEESTDLLEEEAMRRAFHGVEKGVFQKGQRVIDFDGNPAVERIYSDRLLERLLEARAPDRWSQHRKVHHSGEIGRGDGASLQLSPGDLAHLSPEQREQLADILRAVAVGRGEMEAEELESQPDRESLPAPDGGDVIDVDSEPVEQEPDLSEIL